MAVSLTVTTSAIADGELIDASDVTTPISQLKQSVEDTLNGIQAFDRISLGSPEAKTIASGVITVTKTNVTVDTESSAAADDLDTINGGAAGRILYLLQANASRVVTLKHNTGNILTASGADYTLDTTRFVFLIYDGTSSMWIATIQPNNEYLNLGIASALTISSGSVTRSRNRHWIETEGSAAYDELVAINGGTTGDVVYLYPYNVNHVVKVKHGTGNIRLQYGMDRVFLDSRQALQLVYDGAVWSEPGLDFRAFLPTFDKGYFFGENASAATYASVNMAAGTNGGAGAVTNANTDQEIMVSQAIAASAGTFGGRRTSTYNLTRRAHIPQFECVMQTGADITNARYWIGFFSATPTNVDTLAASTSAAAFRYSTVAGDTGWVGVTSDGASQTVSAKVADIALSTRYKMKIWWDASAAAFKFQIDDGLPVALSATLPAASTDLGLCVLKITTTATAKAIAIARYGCRAAGG